MARKNSCDFCTDHSLTPAEFLIFETVSEYAAMPRSQLLGYVNRISPQYETDFRFPGFLCDDWDGPCESLLAKGILREVNVDFLQLIEKYLLDNPASGPAEPLPQLGEIDLTLEGASLWADFENMVHGYNEEQPWPRAWRWEKTPTLIEIYGTSQAGVEDFVQETMISDEYQREHILSVSNTIMTGPWRGRWWELYKKGWLITVAWK